MSFINFNFWALFLPVCFAVYALAGKTARIQNIILLLASVVFYSSYDYKYLLILALSIAVTYFGGYFGARQ